MSKKVKEIGGLSKKAKFNIFIIIFIIFIVASVLASLNQIVNIIKSKEKLLELESKLDYERKKNIELLAEEKSLYNEKVLENEAVKQFNMTKPGQTNYLFNLNESSQGFNEEINNDIIESFSNENTNFDINNDAKNLKEANELQNKDLSSFKYKENDLWQNIKVFYYIEIKDR